jgi:copper(I)-binding protein
VIRIGWGSARPRKLALVAAAALIPVLAGCEAGNNAPTLAFHYPTDAAGISVGGLAIRNVFVLGAPLGRSLVAGQSASVFLALVNNGAPDKLIGITAPGTAASVTLPGNIPINLGHPVFFTGPTPRVVLTDLTRPISSGSTIRLVLTFQKAGPVVLLVPVMARAAHYVTYAPPQPSASPPATGTAAPGTPGGSVSPTPSPTTSG